MLRPILRLAAGLLVGAGCAARAELAQHPPASSRSPAAATVEGRSLFAKPWVWTDENGATVRFEAWRGSPIVMSMIFTDCTSACPLTIDDLRRATITLARENRPATFVLVTLDPRNDTPEQLRRFKASRQLPPEWHLLRGGETDTRELADLLAIHVVESAHIFHDSRVVVFDANGHLSGQLRR